MTTRLYYSDAYLRVFVARPTGVDDEGRRIYLDRTAFYPTSGGQPHDTGVLGGVPVVDVLDEGDRIGHVLERPLRLDLCFEVEGRIDWDRRFDLMQQHTGQHLLSALCADRLGLETVSVHFGLEGSTLDLAGGALEREQLVELEARANEVVRENRAVDLSFEAAGEAAGLRKASTREGTLRVVAIEGLDRSACGGTHVRATGEIGPILLRRAERIRQDLRIEFLCGDRALRRARRDWEVLTRAAENLSAPADDLPALVAGQREQLRELVSARKRLDEELAGYRARELYDRSPAGEDGVRRALLRRGTGSLEDLRPLAQAFAGLPAALLLGIVREPPTLLLAASPDSGVQAGAELRRALAAVGGRGGGSPRIAQGTVPDGDALERVLAELHFDTEQEMH